MTAKVSHTDGVGEYIVVNRQSLRDDDDYRQEVVEALMRDHGDAIMKFCYARLGEVLAQDVTQEVFFTAWQRLPKDQPEVPERPELSLQKWLFGIARHKCQQAFRNGARRRAIAWTFRERIRECTHTEGLPNPEHVAVQAEHIAMQAALCAKLHDAMAKLDPTDCILLTLRYWKELPVSEIADLMQKADKTIQRWLSRAQQRLKDLMDDTPEA